MDNILGRLHEFGAPLRICHPLGDIIKYHSFFSLNYSWGVYTHT